MPDTSRKLAAIMFTDIVGFSAITQEDEKLALVLLKEHRELVRPVMASHGGREVKTMGDGFLIEFASALSATQCAIGMEDAVRKHNAGRPKGLLIRIGVHVGDVVEEEGDVYGDAVNIASRIVGLAGEGGTCISQQVYDQVRNKVPYRFVKLPGQELKNISIPIDVYRLESKGQTATRAQLHPGDSRILAVLPFANMSPDPSDEYFADGMTEEIISTIAKIEQIGVISRTSVMQYKKAPKPVRQISKELGVGTVLEGSVRKAGNKIRVTVQMIDAVKDRHLWAETYERDLSDIFAIQSDIARQVVDALRVKILPKAHAELERKPTSNTEAYTLYLKGRYHWNRRGLDDIRRAEEFFLQAVKEDPGFALGYAGLADCYRTLATNYEVEVEENDRKAESMITRAIELDSTLAEARASRGVQLLWHYDLGEAEREFMRAIELKPSYASAHQWYAQLLIAQLRWDDALDHIEKAVELDPSSLIIGLIHALYFEYKRDYRGGLEFAKLIAEIHPDSAGLHIELALFYGKLKMFDEAKREAEIGASLVQKSYPYAGRMTAALLAYLQDDREAVKKLVPELEAHLGETYSAVRFIADLHFYLGEADVGFEWLEKSYQRREIDLCYIRSNEFMDGVRDDPRYLQLLKKLGLE